MRERFRAWIEAAETFVLEVTFEQHRGKRAALMRGALFALSKVYQVGVKIHRWLINVRIFRDSTLGVQVIAIGNLTWGGTGKTPVVEKFARELRDSGRNVAILTRGYRSKPQPFHQWLTNKILFREDTTPPRIVSDAAGRVRFATPELTRSPALAVAVEDAVDTVSGVRQVHAYPRTGNVVVWYEPERCDRTELVEAIGKGLGADPEATANRSPRSADVRSTELVRLVVGGVALAALGIRRYGLRRPPMLGTASRTVATGVTIFTGYPFLRGALPSLSGGRGAGTDALVSAATVASLVLRENVVALTVLWLLNIGEYLQDLTLRRSRRAISELLTGTQTRTWLRIADEAGEPLEVEVDINSLVIGDEVVLHEHVVLPVDGVVVDGEGVVDQAAITGEQLPISVLPGAQLHAGSVLLRGRLVVRATAVGRDTAIGRIIARVEQAQDDRAPIQTVGENFSRRFVPTSFALAGLTLLVTRDVRRAMTMLLVACPCAVGLSTPTAISAAIGNGARRGILIKGGAHLEAAGRVDAIVFDKTGTLTLGRPVVTNVVSFDDGWTPEQVLAYAASSEIHSRHPLAQAVIRSTEERHIEIPPHEECEVLLGRCREAMGKQSRLLVLELVLPPASQPFFGTLLDLQMLVVTPGGKERTADEYGALFARAGLALTRITPTASPVSVIEGVKVE